MAAASLVILRLLADYKSDRSFAGNTVSVRSDLGAPATELCPKNSKGSGSV